MLRLFREEPMPAPDLHIFDNDLDTHALDILLGSEAVAVDTETMGLVPRRDRLCLVQLCTDSGYLAIVRIGRGQTQATNLRRLLEAPVVLKVFHFARFDVAALKSQLGIQTRPIFCTKIASKLARTYTDKHSLKELVRELEQVDLDKTAQSSDWGNAFALTPQQLAYAANDVRYLLSVRRKLVAMLQREERYELALTCMNHVSAFADLDLLGYGDIFAH